jgi:predicted acyl esterase
MTRQMKYFSLPLALMLSVAAAAQSIPQSTPQFDVYVIRDVMVPMRDGVKLATDVYRAHSCQILRPEPITPSMAMPWSCRT